VFTFGDQLAAMFSGMSDQLEERGASAGGGGTP